MRHYPNTLAFVLAAALMSGCGSSSTAPEGDGDGPGPDGQSATLHDQPMALKLSDNEAEFANYLKNGLLSQRRGGDDEAANGEAGVDFSASPAAAESDSGAGGSADFSTTNVHVEGVDEADRIKYDGEHLFVAEVPLYRPFYPMPIVVDDTGAASRGGEGEQVEENSRVRILSTDPEQAQAEEVASVPLPEGSHSQAHLYLVDGEAGATESLLTVNAGRWSPDDGNDDDYYGPSTQLELFDVSTASMPEQSWSLTLQGSLERSRRIGDQLYLVTRHNPRMPDDFWTYERDEQVDYLADLPLAELLPAYREEQGAEAPLVAADDCYLPENTPEGSGYPQLVTLVAVDLGSREITSSACLNTGVSGFHVSGNSLYLGHSTYTDEGRDVTGVHKFALNEGDLDYRGTGVVPGRLSWDTASFRMDEYDEDLRIVTTEWMREEDDGGSGSDVGEPATLPFPGPGGGGEPVHRLSILREQSGSNELELVSQLPNDQRPAAIGKPGEDIHAVRFVDELAYIVTFLRVDPFYVLDLGDPEQPVIAGELEIPGFSTYLHPVGDGYLLGMGQNTDEDGFPTELKLELFDARDIDNPQSLGVEVIGRGWTPALNDLQALNFLAVGEDQLRFTLPARVADEDYYWESSALYLYEINGLSGSTPQLSAAGKIQAQSADEDGYYHFAHQGADRSRMHGDTVFYLHNNRVWASFWQAPQTPGGPF